MIGEQGCGTTPLQLQCRDIPAGQPWSAALASRRAEGWERDKNLSLLLPFSDVDTRLIRGVASLMQITNICDQESR